jgi:hypothetical protein
MFQRRIYSKSDILDVFRSEYCFLEKEKRISILDLTLDIAITNNGEAVNKPGVYVFWKETLGVIKIGKSQSNSKIRALQHIRDNSKNDKVQMGDLNNDKSCHLFLFNVLSRDDIHWILGLEYFMEMKLNPLIPSTRNG